MTRSPINDEDIDKLLGAQNYSDPMPKKSDDEISHELGAKDYSPATHSSFLDRIGHDISSGAHDVINIPHDLYTLGSGLHSQVAQEGLGHTLGDIAKGAFQTISPALNVRPQHESLDSNPFKLSIPKHHLEYPAYVAPDQDSIATQVGKALPTMLASSAVMGPAEGIASGAIDATRLAKLGSLGKAAAKISKAAGSSAAGGAAAGVVAGQNPLDAVVKNMGLDGFLSILKQGGKGLQTLNPTSHYSALDNLRNTVGNTFLNMARKANKDGTGTVTPAEASKNLTDNFVDEKGAPVPIDFGNLVNNKSLASIYGTTKYVPFSGSSKQSNITDTLLAKKKVSDALGKMGATQDQISRLTKNMPDSPNLAHNLNQLLSPEAKDDVIGHITSSVQAQRLAHKPAIDAAYAPINNSTLRIESANFPNFKSKLLDLAAKKENLTNTFGSDPTLGTNVKKAVANAQSLLDNKDKWGMTYPEAVEQSKSLGNLGYQLALRKHDNESRIIMGVKNALDQDVKDHMKATGNGDLSDQLDEANNLYSKFMAPFNDKKDIRDASKFGVVNHSLPGSLTTKVNVDQDAHPVFHMLPKTTQQAILYHNMLGGKMAVSGDDAKYSKLLNGMLQNRAKILKQVNPQLHATLNTASDDLVKQKQAEKDLQGLHDELSRNQSDLQAAQNKRFGVGTDDDTTNKKLLDLFKMGLTHLKPAVGAAAAVGTGLLGHPVAPGLAALASARFLRKLLESNELKNHYINGTNFTKSSPLSPELSSKLGKLGNVSRKTIFGANVAGENNDQ